MIGTAFATTYDDTTAAPGAVPAPSGVTASQGTLIGGVDVGWTAPSTAAGPPHTYDVVAVYAQGASAPSSSATGWRAAPAVRSYEWSTDDGATWRSDGVSGTSLHDTTAPASSIVPPAVTASPDSGRTLVVLRVAAAPTLAGGEVAYRVRALSADGASTPSDAATGWRGVGTIAYQWQRSADDSDAAYVDLAGVTGSTWVDDTAPKDGSGRYYRVAMTAPAAASAATSAGARGFVRGVTSLSDAYRDACAVLNDGTIGCWGQQAIDTSAFGQPPFTAVGTREESPSACALTPAGDMRCTAVPPAAYGFSASSVASMTMRFGMLCWLDALGHPTCPSTDFSAGATTPTDAFVQLDTNGQAVCGVRADQKVVCWGNPDSGALPVGPSTDAYVRVGVGYSHYCALRADDASVDCFGTTRVPLPANVAGPFTSVSAAGDFTAALRADGHIVAWGDDVWGDVAALPSLASPSAETFTSVQANRMGVCGVRADGKVRCWGGMVPIDPKPGPFVSSGGGCGLRADDATAECWAGGTAAAPPGTWAQLASFSGDTVLDVDYAQYRRSHACAISATDSHVACWGDDYDGESTVPSTVVAAKRVSVSFWDSCAIRDDDKLVCWGFDSQGEAPAGPSTDSFRDVSVGFQIACGILLDGSLTCWGRTPILGGPPWPTGSFTKVSVGDQHACALRDDGKLVCWGNSPDGRAPPGPSAESYLDVSAGSRHTCAVRTDGKVVCFGDDTYAQAPAGPTIDTFVGVSAGHDYSCGTRTDGKMLCWGRDVWTAGPRP